MLSDAASRDTESTVGVRQTATCEGKCGSGCGCGLEGRMGSCGFVCNTSKALPREINPYCQPLSLIRSSSLVFLSFFSRANFVLSLSRLLSFPSPFKHRFFLLRFASSGVSASNFSSPPLSPGYVTFSALPNPRPSPGDQPGPPRREPFRWESESFSRREGRGWGNPA